MTVPDLSFARGPYPHVPIALAVNAGGSPPLNERPLARFALEHKLALDWSGGIALISGYLSGVPASDFLFTGVAYEDQRLVFGSEDSPVPERLGDAYGEFSLLRIFDDRLELSTDYFGYGKWYCYFCEDIFCAATSYHLLLLLIKECGVTMEMDIERSSKPGADRIRFYLWSTIYPSDGRETLVR